MSAHRLILECMNGPQDGAKIEIAAPCEWSRVGGSPLAFPWDNELGEPQCRITLEGNTWIAEHVGGPHGTYCANCDGRPERRFSIHKDMILKASKVWLRVLSAE